jgi:hypothetical protein
LNSNFKLKIKNYLEKLRELSDKQKKIVLWTIVAVLAVTMGYFWIRGTMDSLSKIGKSVGSINLPSSNLPSASILQTTTPSNENPVITKNVSEQDAINLVKNLPEVKKWLSLFAQPDGSNPKTGGKPVIELGSKNENTYFIHVYELLSDHSATFNWYDVDIKTGNIKPEF